MSQDQNPFTPEEVDEQLAQLSTTREGTSSEQRLMRELQATYGAEQETAQAVEQVWQRLEQSHSHLMHPVSPSDAKQTHTLRPRRNEGNFSMEYHPKRRRWLMTGALAAALLLIVLAGSLLTLATKNHSTITGSNSSATPSPTPTATTYLYVASSTSVYKIDLVTGKIKWHYQAGSVNTYNITGSIIFNNTVYFADQSHTLYAVDAQNGQLKWKLPAQGDDILYHPQTDGTTLYIQSHKKGFCSVDTQAGKLLQCEANLNPFMVRQGIAYGFNPVGADVYQTSIYAFDTFQKKILWQQTVPLEGQGFQQMTYAAGTLYATSETTYDKSSIPALSSYLYAYNAQSGVLLWKSKKVASDLILNPPAVANGAVYFGSQDGHGGALNATNGDVLWTIDEASGGPGGYIYPTPAVADGVVYMGVTDNNSSDLTKNYLIALTTTHGTQVWKQPLKAYMGAQLLLNNGIIYTGTSDGDLHAIKASDGTEIWHVTLGGRFEISQTSMVAP